MTALHTFADEIGAIKRDYLDDNFTAYGLIVAIPGTDIGPAINANLARFGYARIPPGAFQLRTAIVAPSTGATIEATGATITAVLPGSPVISFLNAGSFLSVLGGLWVGVANEFLLAQGTTNQPTLIGQYARFIWLDRVVVSGTYTNFCTFNLAVREVFLSNCDTFTANGIIATGKCVDVARSNCTLFGSTGAAGTRGIQLTSPGGTSFYNEGWSATNCTDDNFEYTYDVADIFVLECGNCYIGAAAGGRAFNFRQPATTQNGYASIHGNVIASKVVFGQYVGGAYNSLLTDNTYILTNGGRTIEIQNGANVIRINDSRFGSSSGGAEGVRTTGAGNNGIICEGLDFDSTYTNGVNYSHSAGVGNAMRNLTGIVAGELWSKPAALSCLMSGLPIYTAAQRALVRTYNPVDLATTYAVGVAISTLALSFSQGETGWIDLSLPCSGMNAATQRFDIAVPAGVNIPTGVGWAANFLYPSSAGALVVGRIPYDCSADVTGNMSITNAAGNTVTLNSHGRFGIERHL